MTEYVTKTKALIFVEHNKKHLIPEKRSQIYFELRKQKKIPYSRFLRFFDFNREIYDYVESN